MILFFIYLKLFSSSPFLDPYIIDPKDLVFDENYFMSENNESDASDGFLSQIKTEDILFVPLFYKSSLYYAIGANVIYSYTYKNSQALPSSVSLQTALGSNDYLNAKLLFDTLWYENKNNFILGFDISKYYNNYYSRGFSDPSFIGYYSKNDLDFLISYRRNIYFLYLSMSYLFNRQNLDLLNTDLNIDKSTMVLSGLSIGLDNKISTNIINKKNDFYYGFYFYYYLKALNSYDNIKAIKFDLEHNYFISKFNKLNFYFEYKAYLKKDIPYLALYTPVNKLRPYSYNKYIDSQFMFVSLDLLLLLASQTYISVNGGAYQSKASFNDFILNDNIYSYGLGLVFPVSRTLSSRIDYSISKDEKNIFLSLSSSIF